MKTACSAPKRRSKAIQGWAVLADEMTEYDDAMHARLGAEGPVDRAAT